MPAAPSRSPTPLLVVAAAAAVEIVVAAVVCVVVAIGVAVTAVVGVVVGESVVVVETVAVTAATPGDRNKSALVAPSLRKTRFREWGENVQTEKKI